MLKFSRSEACMSLSTEGMFSIIHVGGNRDLNKKRGKKKRNRNILET